MPLALARRPISYRSVQSTALRPFLVRRTPRGLRGLGDLTPAQIASYQALGYSNIGGAPVGAGTFSGPAYGPTNPAQPTSGAMVTITNALGNSQQVETLDAFLQDWVAGVCAMPASLSGQDAMGQAAAIAADRCQTISTPDCGQASSLAAQYGKTAAKCVANVSPASTAAPGTSGGVPGYTQVNYSTPSAPGASPQVVNQFATSSNGPNQSFVGNGAGQSNAPGASFVMPDFSSIPSWVWLAGGGLVVFAVAKGLFK